mmetsp:Transcript_22012/g.47970  ORF Transcript_22012/g.47970 Transcript_22012/m.47970 type:complete len:116 (-) Transcript_22012:335-682(-)
MAKSKPTSTRGCKPSAKKAPPPAKGRPPGAGPRPFTCEVEGCEKSYPSSGGLHQHKRNKHPELIVPRGSHGSNTYRKYSCQVEGCEKSYDTSAGLYQHKKAKHPELIGQRKGGKA